MPWRNISLIFRTWLRIKNTSLTFRTWLQIKDINLTFRTWLQIYDKRDDFNFKIINFPNMCSNIPASPAYGVYISQLIRYAMASSNYSDFLKPWNVIFIWETSYWTRAITRFALFDLLKCLYSDTKILSKYIPSLQKRL